MSKKQKNVHAVALGRLGGRGLTPKKLAALKRNAQTAGRKPKFQVGDEAIVNEQAPTAVRGLACMIERVGPEKSQYVVRFFTTYRLATLRSWYLDKP